MDSFLIFAAIKCFGELGCFPVDGPFRSSHRPISVSPFAPHVINSTFLLYTRIDPTFPQIFSLNDVLNATRFRAWRQSKVIIHGYQEDGFTKQWIKDMVEALLKKNDLNVFVVDWGKGAHTHYPQAVANARVVGRIIARLIDILKENQNATAESFHLIGHSLGAHIAGYAGNQTPRLGRISGLDPARPYFEGTDEIVRLDTSDANFVDVIHTDAKPFWRGGMGMRSPCGHLDFYPNGGRNQAGCNGPIMKTVLKEKKNFVFGMRQWVTCSHKRAHILYTESIGSECPFISFPCHSHSAFRLGKCFGCGHLDQDCSVMGFRADEMNKNSRKIRKYFLLTSSQSPHCQMQNRITVHVGKWSGHAGSFIIHISQNRTTNNKPIRVKLNTKAMSRRRISAIFTSPNSPKHVSYMQIEAEWHSDQHTRVNPFTYFNGNIPKLCITSVVIQSITFNKEIISRKFISNDGCGSDEKQTFSAVE